MGESVATIPIKRPTRKQIKFFRALIRTQNPTEAALEAYHCKNRTVAQVLGSKTMRALNIPLTEALNLCGLDITKDIEDIKALSEATHKDRFGNDVSDNDARFKTLQLRMRIKGEIRERFEVEAVHKHFHFFQDLVQRSTEMPEAIKQHIETTSEEVKE